ATGPRSFIAGLKRHLRTAAIADSSRPSAAERVLGLAGSRSSTKEINFGSRGMPSRSMTIRRTTAPFSPAVAALSVYWASTLVLTYGGAIRSTKSFVCPYTALVASRHPNSSLYIRQVSWGSSYLIQAGRWVEACLDRLHYVDLVPLTRAVDCRTTRCVSIGETNFSGGCRSSISAMSQEIARVATSIRDRRIVVSGGSVKSAK